MSTSWSMITVFALVAVGVSWAATAEETINDVTTTKAGATWCPAPLVGTKCGESSVFHYYKCCGTLNNECCFNLQMWVIVTLAVLGVIFLASFVLSLIRCLCCRR